MVLVHELKLFVQGGKCSPSPEIDAHDRVSYVTLYELILTTL